MKEPKEIKITATYRDFEYYFQEIPILIRYYFATDAAHIRIDEGFARANGFGSLEELYTVDPLKSTVQWVDAELLGKGIVAGVINDNCRTPIN